MLSPGNAPLNFYDFVNWICFRQKCPDKFSNLCFQVVLLTGKVGIYTARL
jgi:hypothetical protein